MFFLFAFLFSSFPRGPRQASNYFLLDAGNSGDYIDRQDSCI